MSATPRSAHTSENAGQSGKQRIRIAAAIIKDGDGKVLLVRKKGTRAFMQAGGKIEPGEDPIQALHREVAEELGSTIAKAEFVGTFSAPAANEENFEVFADIFWAELASRPAVGAEIEELLWTDRSGLERDDLAPLSRILLERSLTN